MSLAERDAPAPFKPLKQKPPKISVRREADGTVYISSGYPLGEMKRGVVHILEDRAAMHPQRRFIGERGPDGAWRFIGYGEANVKANAVASALLARGMNADTPLMVLSGNSIAHAVMALGAMKAGVPVAPVSVPYSLMSSDFSKLRHVVGLTKPRMIFADHGDLYGKAIAAVGNGAEIVTCTGSVAGATSFDDLVATPISNAAKFVDESRPELGLVFDGRVTEDFKLSSGTWVSTGTLRADAVAACTPLVQDAAVCDLDKPYIAMLVRPNIAAARKVAGLADDASPDDAIAHPKVAAHLREVLARHNKSVGGSSTRIARIHLMLEPPSIDGHEITDKGDVNQAATASRRAYVVERLYIEPAPADVIVV